MLIVGKELYRALWREARALPDKAATAHYYDLIRTSFTRIAAAPESSQDALKRVKEAQRPFILSPTSSPHSKHAFSPPLSALLSSPLAHLSRPPTPANLRSPPSLPPRADPSSEAARLLGPLTPQRINKIRLRYYNHQIGKLRAPIAVKVRGLDGEVVEDAKRASVILEKAGLKGVDVAGGWEMLEELEKKARVPDEAKPRLPRRLQTMESKQTKGPAPKASTTQAQSPPRILSPSSKNTKWHLPNTISDRLLRRRYAEILKESPVVVFTESRGSGEEKKTGFTVVNSPWAKGGVGHQGNMSEEDLWWLKMDEGLGGGDDKRKNKGKKVQVQK
ncbi:hypothetical protein P7C70_g3912, partial [Phenoliferia sp. Uapishka_3]